MSSSHQGTAKRLSKIAEHFLGSTSCTRTRMPIQSLCDSMEQLRDEREVKKTELLEENNERFSTEFIEPVPNESWSKETLKLYSDLRKLVDESNGLWEIPKYGTFTGQFGSLNCCVDKNGKRLFEFCFGFNKSEKRLKGFCQFGPWTMGPRGYIHGGAIATLLDITTSSLPRRCGYSSLTANLSVDFKEPVPIGSTVLVEATIHLVKGKKIYVYGEMKSSDGLTLYASSKTLCIKKSGFSLV